MLLDGAREAIAAVVGARTQDVDLAPSHTAALHAAVRSVARGRRRTGSDVVVGAVERAAVLNAADFAGHRVTVPVDRDRAGGPDAFVGARRPPGRGARGPAARERRGGHAAARRTRCTTRRGRRVSRCWWTPGRASATWTSATPGTCSPRTRATGAAPPGSACSSPAPGVRRSPDWPEDEDRWFPGGVSVPAHWRPPSRCRWPSRSPAPTDAAARRPVARPVAAEVPDVDVVGDPVDRLPHVLTFSCLYVEGEALLGALDARGFAVGSGSACTSSALEPSHVLAAMGALTHGNIRLALPRGTLGRRTWTGSSTSCPGSSPACARPGGSARCDRRRRTRAALPGAGDPARAGRRGRAPAAASSPCWPPTRPRCTTCRRGRGCAVTSMVEATEQDGVHALTVRTHA